MDADQPQQDVVDEQPVDDQPADEPEMVDAPQQDVVDEPQEADEPEQPADEPDEPEQKEEPEEEPEDAVEEYNGDLPKTIEEGCNNLYSDTPSFNWMITKLTDAKKGKDGLVVDSVGKGGLNELKDKVKDRAADILFFSLRVNTFDNEGSSRAKFIYGRFMGSNVKFMQKAKLTPQLGQIADCFQVKHVSRDADEGMKDWTPEILGKEFLRIGGAHKPSRYDFGPNAVYTV